MRSHTEHLTFNLPTRMAFENITPKVEAIVRESGISEGLVLCNAMHITASVFINDDESGLHEDYKAWLERFPVATAWCSTSWRNRCCGLPTEIRPPQSSASMCPRALDDTRQPVASFPALLRLLL